MGKACILFLLKVVVGTTIFWLSWVFIFRPMSAQTDNISVMSGVAERQHAEDYEKQLRLADEQLELSRVQQKRMDQLLDHYEQQVKRYDAILQKWESQANVR